MSNKYVTFYVLENYDGGDGRYNKPSGFITKDKKVADEWSLVAGNSYKTFDGVIVDSLAELEDASTELAKKRALDKLTEEEKKLLGLI